MTTLKTVLHSYATSERARVSQRFFKTGPGEYGEGDVFIGVTVPQCRTIAKQFKHLTLNDIESHLASPIHEERLVALLVLIEKYKKEDKKAIVDFYLRNVNRVNNWDLVDLSADKLVGDYLQDKDSSILYRLARSNHLWSRRVAIVSTFAFIKKKKFEQTLKLVELLMQDEHDLIQKACGWMLREIGKRNEKYLDTFLAMHYSKMPRTMLRYAIERFPETRRKAYLEGTI